MMNARASQYYLNALSALYLLLSQSDGEEDEREKRMLGKMLVVEGIDPVRFGYLREGIEGLPSHELYEICLRTLKSCSKDLQVRCIAWMTIIANADGFMAPDEWKLIYKIYHTDLGLDLKQIMTVQKQLLAPINGDLRVV
jgi:hypothetical protein